jgi:hypothetical protein
MASAKTTTLTFRIEPKLTEVLRTAAAHEHRSIANMVEVRSRSRVRCSLTRATNRSRQSAKKPSWP